jgi:hypothetical protein
MFGNISDKEIPKMDEQRKVRPLKAAFRTSRYHGSPRDGCNLSDLLGSLFNRFRTPL